MIDDGAAGDPGGRADPNARPCDDCGHVWFAGERRHEYLDSSGDGRQDAEVICVLCREQRGLTRST